MAKKTAADTGIVDCTEQKRLNEAREAGIPWKKWGPYLSERQWGTVREDYSENGNAWDYFTHDQSRSRAYRWGEDGLGGFSDDKQRLCFALALWNERDPILKERAFGLTNSEGNHGEDVKEYYFYVDSTPTHSYMKYLYKYPQREYPYRDLVETNRRRTKEELEYELLDTGVFEDDRYFDVFLEYAKEGPEDILIKVSVHNRGKEAARLQLLPTLWFRNTWSWGDEGEKPVLREKGGAIVASHPELGEYTLSCGGKPELLFTENESNAERLWGQPNPTPYVKDAFHRYVISGEKDAVNPAKTGTKAAARYVLEVPAGGVEFVQLRLSKGTTSGKFGAAFEEALRQRLLDADEFYERITPRSLGEDERRVHRQAIAGMLWTKQYYYFDLDRWLKEHQAHPMVGGQGRVVRNAEWFHMLNGDVISMPDKWEYPWYAAWDLAFHTIALSLVDFDFAKEQLLLMLRSLYSHPNGQMPAYEWNFSDVNPPVHAWATLFLYKMEKNLGREDVKFLARSFQGLMLNFNWWVNRKDPQGKNVFAGGFLGLDNIGVFDRSAPLPTGGSLEQADGTAWMAFYCQNMLEMALDPRRPRPGLRGGRLQVPRELHLDRLRDGQGRREPRRHVGRGGRLLLRRPPAAGRRGVPAEGPLDGGAPAAVCEHGHRGGRGHPAPEADGADRALQEALPRGDRPRGSDHRRFRRPRRAPAPLAAHPDEARAHPRLPARRERVPLPLRHPRAVPVPPRPPVRLPGGGPGVPRRVRPRRLRQRDVRGELELARADLDAGQRPDRPGAAQPLRLLWRRLQGRVPDRLREPHDPLRGREGDHAAPVERLPA